MQENNKKTLILSILGVLVLIIAVVGVSFAMYSFSADGTRENVITTGKVSITYDTDGICIVDGVVSSTVTTQEACTTAGGTWYPSGVIALTNQYPSTDTVGLENDGVSFTVVADYPGNMVVDYALQFVDVTPDTYLTTSNVKVQVIKYVGSNEGSAIVGTSTTGVKLNTLASNVVTNTKSAVKSSINGTTGNTYVFDEGTLTAKGTISYTVKAWVADDYELDVTGNSTTTAKCDTDPTTNNTAALCEAAGGSWIQTEATSAQTLTFKIRVVAAQRVES